MINVIQTNLKRMGSAMNLLSQAARERETDVLIISEQPRGPPDGERRQLSVDSSTQVVLTDSARLTMAALFHGKGYVRVSAGGIVFVSCDLPPRLTNAQYADVLGEMEETCQRFPHDSLLV